MSESSSSKAYFKEMEANMAKWIHGFYRERGQLQKFLLYWTQLSPFEVCRWNSKAYFLAIWLLKEVKCWRLGRNYIRTSVWNEERILHISYWGTIQGWISTRPLRVLSVVAFSQVSRSPDNTFLFWSSMHVIPYFLFYM